MLFPNGSNICSHKHFSVVIFSNGRLNMGFTLVDIGLATLIGMPIVSDPCYAWETSEPALGNFSCPGMAPFT